MKRVGRGSSVEEMPTFIENILQNTEKIEKNAFVVFGHFAFFPVRRIPSAPLKQFTCTDGISLTFELQMFYKSV